MATRTIKRVAPLLDASPNAIMDRANVEFDHIYGWLRKAFEAIDGGLPSDDGGGGGTAGVKYWDELLKRSDASISAQSALGDWIWSMPSLAVHVQTATDPHAPHQIQTVGLRTPLVDSTKALNLLPALGQALLIGQVGGTAGTFRRLEWGDNPVINTNFGFSLDATNTTASAGSSTWQSLLNVQNKVTAVQAAKVYRAASGQTLVQSGADIAGAVGYEGQALMYVGGVSDYCRGTFGLAGTNDATYTGTLPLAYGSYVEVRNLHHATGAITTAIGFGMDDPQWSGPIGTLIGLDIPALTKGTTNYLARFGAGTILANGGITLLSADPTYIPLTIKGAASQSGDLLDVVDSNDAVLARINELGYLGIGVDPSYPLDIQTGAIRIKTGADVNYSQYNAIIMYSGDATYHAKLSSYQGTSATRCGLLFATSDNSLPMSRMFLAPSGRLGINTADPLARFHVISDETGTPVEIIAGMAAQSADLTQWQDSSANVLARINELGYLGIGVDPSYSLEIAGSASNVQILATRASSTAAACTYVSRFCRGSIASPSAAQSNDGLMVLMGRGYGATGWLTTGSYIRIAAAENFTDAAGGSKIEFYTTPTSSTTAALALTIGTDKGLALEGKVTEFNNVACEGYGVPAIVDMVHLTGQTADIAATNCTNTNTAGTYRVSYYLYVTKANGGPGGIILDFDWNDGAAKTYTETGLPLTSTTGYRNGSFLVYNASGYISYNVTHTGDFLGADYGLDICVERVN